MVEFVQGYKDVYGKIHPTREAAELRNEDYNLSQAMYSLVNEKIPLIRYPDNWNVADYIVANYRQIKLIMEPYGR